MITSLTQRVLAALAKIQPELAAAVANDLKAMDIQETDPPAIRQAKLQQLFIKYQVVMLDRQEVLQ